MSQVSADDIAVNLRSVGLCLVVALHVIFFNRSFLAFDLVVILKLLCAFFALFMTETEVSCQQTSLILQNQYFSKSLQKEF